jgi:hypothetical protein
MTREKRLRDSQLSLMLRHPDGPRSNQRAEGSRADFIAPD